MLALAPLGSWVVPAFIITPPPRRGRRGGSL
jgi:hypothetical protein